MYEVSAMFQKLLALKAMNILYSQKFSYATLFRLFRTFGGGYEIQ